MKKLSFLLFALPLFILSCKKDDKMQCNYTTPTTVATPAEIAYLQDYLSTNGINAIQHPSGVFYVINTEGTGSMPTICSHVTVRYTGKLLNGNIFDQNLSVTGVKFALGYRLIHGWQTALQVVKTGSSVSLYIPPSLGYGSEAIVENNVVIIPANSYLHFDIELLDVQ